MNIFLESHNINNKAGGLGTFNYQLIKAISNLDITDLDNVEIAIKEIEKQIHEFKKGYIPDSPISIASSAKIIQNDSDLAEEIADKLGYFTHFSDYSSYSYDDNVKIDEISRKLWGLREYSNISLEEINSKLDQILNKL